MTDHDVADRAERVTHRRTCPLCEATCGLELTVVDTTVVRVRGDRRDNFSRGFICPKGASVGHLHRDPDRLRRPIVRSHGEWGEVAWETAFGIVADRLSAVRRQHGPDAVAVYFGNPTAHNLGPLLYRRSLLQALSTRQVYSAGTLDQIPKQVACALMYGSSWSVGVPDIDRTDLLVVIGANPMVSNGSLLTAPDLPRRLRDLRDRGGRLVVVDPRRTETADVGDAWLPIRPGGDAFLLLTLMHFLFVDGLVDLGGLAGHVRGVDALQQLTAGLDVAEMCRRSGIDADTIRQLAQDLADAPSAAVYGRIGTCTQTYGTLTSWLIDVVNALTGNLDRVGGVMFPMPLTGSPTTRPSRSQEADVFGPYRSRVRGAAAVLGELPVAVLAEEIATPGPGQVQALLTLAGNPMRSAPEPSAMTDALGSLQFMVSVDIYLNETTRYADVILPPASPLSESHYDQFFYNFAVRNVGKYSPPVLPPEPGTMPEWLILCQLAADVDPSEGLSARDVDDQAARRLLASALRDRHRPADDDTVTTMLHDIDQTGPERLLDILLRAGPYGDFFGCDPSGITLTTLLDHPDGVDQGPLAPRFPGALRTRSGCIELAPQILVDHAREATRVAEPADPPLVLVGRRDLRSNNSWMHNIDVLVKGRPRCTLQIHPTDAQHSGIQDGDVVTVRSAAGSVVVPVDITDRMRPGVVALPHGWGHDDDHTELRVARRRPGVNSNALASTSAVDSVTGTAALNGIAVTLERVEPVDDTLAPTPADQETTQHAHHR